MRRVFAALGLAFLMSSAIAEWPRTTRRVFTGTIDDVDRAFLTVGSWSIPVEDLLAIENTDATDTLKLDELTVGDRVLVTLRCVPNSDRGCVPESVRLLASTPPR